MSFQSRVICTMMPISQGKGIITSFLHNDIAMGQARHPTVFTLEVCDLFCTSKTFLTGPEPLVLISPQILIQHKFDQALISSYNILSTVFVHGDADHRLSLSSPTPLELCLFGGSTIEIYVCRLDNQTLKHTIVEAFDGWASLKIVQEAAVDIKAPIR